MPIDPNIIAGIKPVQIQQADPLDQYGKSLALKGLLGQQDLQALQMKQATQGVEDDAAVRSAYQQSGGDSKTLRALLTAGGQHKAIQALDKFELDKREKTSTIDKNETETNIKRAEHAASILSVAKDDPTAYPVVRRLLQVQYPQLHARLPEQYDAGIVNGEISAGMSYVQKMTAEQKAKELALKTVNEPFVPGPTGAAVANPDVQAFLKEKAAKSAPVVNVSQSTEKRYGEHFASEMAKADAAMRDVALKASDLAQRANQIKEVLASGKVITGAGADYRLALGKALNLVGANDGETAANTEALATQLARNTLDGIKASGLGSGSGFSNADRDFLEKAVGGKLSLQAETIDRLASLAHRTAEQSAKKWGDRVKNIPAEALKGTGLDVEQIQVPPMFKAPAKPGATSDIRSQADAILAGGK